MSRQWSHIYEWIALIFLLSNIQRTHEGSIKGNQPHGDHTYDGKDLSSGNVGFSSSDDHPVDDFVLEGDVLHSRMNSILKVDRWIDGRVPYVTYDIHHFMKSLLKTAMQEIEDRTCIKFERMSIINETYYLDIFRGDGCWSHVGMVVKGGQKLSLGKACEQYGVVLHELMHALGFMHEHSRFDRDDYLDIDWSNVNSDEVFERKRPRNETEDLGEKYDYLSVMHYHFTYMARNESIPTMTRKYGSTELGNDEFSDGDIRKINKFYDCPFKKDIKKIIICTDDREPCSYWAKDLGYCNEEKFIDFMRYHCQLSCKTCHKYTIA